MRNVEVLPPNSTWPAQAESEAQQVQQALGNIVVAVHHIGSTSIPHIYAKPIIDLLVEVPDIAAVDDRTAAMAALGYEAMGEYGIPGRRYFRKDDATGTRTHHVHTFQVGSADVLRHLAFRDFLTAHRDYAQQYSDLKRHLAAQYPTDIDSYMDGKAAFIQEMQRRALAWQAMRR
jgi:GrpB-like predicted nucleotidyltransferase (UPF0157 family)